MEPLNAYSSILQSLSCSRKMAVWKFFLLTGIGYLAMQAMPATSSEQNIMVTPSNLEILNDSTSNNETTDKQMDMFFINNTDFSLLEEFTNESMIPEVLNSNSETAPNNSKNLNDATEMSATDQPIPLFLSTLFPEYAIPLTMAASTKTSKIAESIGSSQSNKISLADNLSWFVLILDGNCSLQGDDLDNLKDRLTDELVIRLGLHRRNLNVKNTSCSSSDQMHINLTVSELCKNLSTLLMTNLLQMDNLSSSSPLVRIKHHDYYVHKILTTDGFLVIVEPDMIPVDMRHSDVELIICIAVGSACAFLILLVAGLLTFKYCNTCCTASQKPTYFLDYHREVLPTNSHLQNMHLEDYTLTRIPRPKLGYIDYCRGASSSIKRYSPLGDSVATEPNGMVQPFDTSVVPLEDVHGEVQCTDGVIVRPMDIRRYGQSITRFYRNGRGLKSPKKSETSGTGEGSYQVCSTENLQVNDQMLESGHDNPVYQQ